MYELALGVFWLISAGCGDKTSHPAAHRLANGGIAAYDTVRDTALSALSASSTDSLAPIASWLLLRTAAQTPDSAARAALYAKVTLPAAHDRIPWVEAQALEQSGNSQGALRAYSALGARISVFRLRYELAKTDGDRAGVRRSLLAFITSSPSPEMVRDGYWLFDHLFPTTTPQEDLAIARAAADIGAWSRARTGFANADRRHLLNATDRFRYGMSLAQANLDTQAADQYAKISSPRPLAAAARYQSARAFVALNNLPKAESQLHALTNAYPADTSTASALMLLADLASDARDDATARSLFLDLAKRFPKHRLALSARFNAAYSAYVLGDYPSATTEFTALTHTFDSTTATYWLGRAQANLGHTNEARAAWHRVIQHDSTSYYAVLAAKRLDIENLHDFPDSVTYPDVASVDSALYRIALLRSLNMTPEIRFEYDRLFHDAPTTHDQLLATASAMEGSGQEDRGIALGRRALSAYGASAAIYRLIYPLAARDTIITSARTYGLDPVLIAALIRQESNFDPRATSPVGARGLMQLMPSLARSIAASRGITPWTDTMLYNPGINIMLGVAHLAPLVQSQPDIVRVLAAYNAGESRVTRWAQKRGADDPEIFTERIPFNETRDYVKNIIRNRELYRTLYSW